MHPDPVLDISVVIPVFGRQDLVLVAIRSALAQEGVHLEVLVVDDGSIPPLDFRSLADSRLRVIRHASNRGAAAARNTGVAAARGRFIAFLDSDDTWVPNKLERQLEIGRDCGDLTVVATGWWCLREGTVSRDAMVPDEADSVEDFARGIWFCAGSTAIIPRRAFAIVGPQDENLASLEDYDWFIRFAAVGGALRVLPSPVATIRWRRHRDWRVIDEACERLMAKHVRGPDAPGGIARRRVRAHLWVVRASRRWYAKRWAAALWLLFRSWLVLPRLSVRLAEARRLDETAKHLPDFPPAAGRIGQALEVRAPPNL